MPSDSSKRKLLKDFFTVILYSLWHWNMRVIFFKSLFIFFFFQFCVLFPIFLLSFPPTAFLCYSSTFSPSLYSSASFVSFQSPFLVIRFFFDAFFYSHSSVLLSSSRLDRLSLSWFLEFVPLTNRLLNIWRLKLIYVIYNGLVPTSQITDHFY